MIDAIVYVSYAGHTKRYAQMLSSKLGIPSYSLKESKKNISKKSDIIFLTWVRAGKLVKLKKARSRYNIKAIGAVGMSNPSKVNTANLQNNNKINLTKEKFFYLPGGFNMDNLKGINLTLMLAMKRSLTKISESRKLSLEQRQMLDMLNTNKDNVKENNIREIYSWYMRESKKK